jgi:hypothetical protein
MNIRSLRTTSIVAAAALTLAGCASIVSGRRSDVAFNTYPPGAHVAIRDRRGQQITSFNTPGVANLKRQGRFFMPAHYTAIISAPGYQTSQVPIGSTLNPWILGNILIGGVPGIFIDSATGAAWKPKRSEINQHLAPLSGPEYMPAFSDDDSTPSDSVKAAQYTADESASPGAPCKSPQ